MSGYIPRILSATGLCWTCIISKSTSDILYNVFNFETSFPFGPLNDQTPSPNLNPGAFS